MANLARRFCKDQSGSAALEYSILAATVSVMLIAAMEGLGFKMATTLARAGLLSLGAISP